jgi:hypothetical protein
MLTCGWIEHQDRSFEPSDVIVPPVVTRNVTQTEVDEHCLAGVVNSTVRENITHVVEAQISLRKAAICMVGDNRNACFPHSLVPPHEAQAASEGLVRQGGETAPSNCKGCTYIMRKIVQLSTESGGKIDCH